MIQVEIQSHLNIRNKEDSKNRAAKPARFLSLALS